VHTDEGLYSKPIPGFQNYFIYNNGTVINVNTGREMVLSPTMHGDLTVGLTKAGVQHRRSVKVLVAHAFVDGYTDFFNTPIQLDGRMDNLNDWNIRWRPRWFAWKYARQLSDTHPGWFYNGPIFDTTHGIQYATIFEAAITNGNLCDDIRSSLLDDIRVFPTGEIYTY
jgi:hypothetical protein